MVSGYKDVEDINPMDLVINTSHWNSQSKRLVFSTLNPNLFTLIDLENGPHIEWRLPFVESAGTPLAITSDFDKIVVAYETNHILVFDLVNKQLHPWSVNNFDNLPKNWLSRYNRITGLKNLSDTKFLLFTNYSFSILDLDQPIPQESLILSNHPTKTAQGA